MEYNVSQISRKHDFVITGVSYIGNPKPHTTMYVTKKAGKLLENLQGKSLCLVFAENGLEVNESVLNDNCFIFSDNPQRDYAQFINTLYDSSIERERQRKYTLAREGYYVGENVEIGSGAYIEPGCLIGHDVIIGDDACIFSGTVIKNAIIGDHFIANENAVIGAFGFTITEDEDGNNFRIPTLGKVRIGNYVEIGAHDNVSCGSSGDTVIEDYAKVDALVHIGHDAHIGKNVIITAGSIIGGFADLGNKAYTGINASIRNRINLGDGCLIGMGATVTKSVDPGVIVAGNPARRFENTLK